MVVGNHFALNRNACLDMHVLLTNDDGIQAQGLWAVARQLMSDSRVSRLDIIAPQVQQSGVSHSITYLTPLTPSRTVLHGKEVWTVNGTPADCVKLGVMSLLDARPDMVISGLNEGLNTGINSIYSGTVAGAREATFFAISGVALSLEYGPQMDFEAAAAKVIPRAISMVTSLLQQGHQATLLNINVPQSAVMNEKDSELATEWKTVPMKLTRHDDLYLKRQDPKQREYFWSTDKPFVELPGDNTDVDSVAGGAITVTPMHFDLTDYKLLQNLE